MMMRGLPVALLSLPIHGVDMNNPGASLPDKRWDMESINHLTESTTKLIQHSVTTKITPTIERFAQATMQKIEDDVIPALADEHQISVDLLNKEHERFQALKQEIDSKKAEIASKDEECSRYTTEHQDCREEEHEIVTQVTECTNTTSEHETKLTECEEKVTITEGDIDSLWCEQVFDALSDDFYHASKATMQKYIERKRKCETIRNVLVDSTPECETKEQTYTQTRTKCNTKQSTLEQCSCERANLVEHWTDHFKLEWQNLTSIYQDLVTESEETASQRKKEFEGLHLVKCLLSKIVAIGQTDGPCNESHVEQVTAEIQACHDEEHDSTHLDLHPTPAPELPDLYAHAAFPCGADFIALHYSHLPADAAQGECNSQWCSPRLVHETVVETSVEH